MITDKPKAIPDSDIVKEITSSDLSKLLKGHHRTNIQGVTTSILLSDSKFKVPHIQPVKDFLQQNSIDEEEFESTYHDCDDFAHQLFGALESWCSYLPFGLIWGVTQSGEYHAANIVYAYEENSIDSDDHFYYIEPQTDFVGPLKQSFQRVDLVLM